MNKYYYTYKVILHCGSLAGKVYYGQHSTNDLYDGYRGSGTIIKDYYKKYPEISSSTIFILKFYNNNDELNDAEYELIKPHLNKEYCLNLKDGGGNRGRLSEATKKKISEAQKGEKHHFYGKHHSEETKKKISDSNIGKHNYSEEIRKKMSESQIGHKDTEETRMKKSKSHIGKRHSEETRKKLGNSFRGKHHSEEAKKKMSEAKKGKYSGNKNPMFGKSAIKGKKYMNNNVEQICVNKADVNYYESLGYKLGRLKK